MSELYHSGRPFSLWSKEAQARHRARFGRSPNEETDRRKWRERDQQLHRNGGKKHVEATPSLRSHPSDSAWTKPAQNRPQSQERVYDSSKIKKKPGVQYVAPYKPGTKNPPKPGSKVPTKHDKAAIVKKAVAKTKEEMRKKR